MIYQYMEDSTVMKGHSSIPKPERSEFYLPPDGHRNSVQVGHIARYLILSGWDGYAEVLSLTSCYCSLESKFESSKPKELRGCEAKPA